MASKTGGNSMNEWCGSAAWRLRYIAGAHTRAKRLEALRETFHRELYASVVVSTALYGHDPFRERSTRTDQQAIRIIQAKERYERQVEKERTLATEWQELLDALEPGDRALVDYHFRKRKHISRTARHRILTKYKLLLERQERKVEQTRTERAKQAFMEHQKDNRWRDVEKFKARQEHERRMNQHFETLNAMSEQFAL